MVHKINNQKMPFCSQLLNSKKQQEFVSRIGNSALRASFTLIFTHRRELVRRRRE
jgi:hypothetical protein